MDHTTINTLIASLGGTLPTGPRERFSPSRYPYTYAYDYLRGDCNAPGYEGIASRGEMAEKVGAYCEYNGLDKDETCAMLADRYIADHGIEILGTRARHCESGNECTITSIPFIGAPGSVHAGRWVCEVEYAAGCLRPLVPLNDLGLVR